MALAKTERLHITLRGVVQGVGFPPVIYCLAQKLHLAGWVRNQGDGVEIEVEGGREQLESFLRLLKSERPRQAVVTVEELSSVAPLRGAWFEILPGDQRAQMTTPPPVP